MNRSSINSWGPSGWNFIHAVSYSYPKRPTSQDKLNMYKFLTNFARVLPCKRCRDDFTAYIDLNLSEREGSSALMSNETFVHFLVDAHNHVNQKLGKRTYTYREVDKMYTSVHSKRSGVNVLLILFVLILLICKMVHRCSR